MITWHPRTLLVVVAEAAIEKPLLRTARELGVQGWTVGEVHGRFLEGELARRFLRGKRLVLERDHRRIGVHRHIHAAPEGAEAQKEGHGQRVHRAAHRERR